MYKHNSPILFPTRYPSTKHGPPALAHPKLLSAKFKQENQVALGLKARPTIYVGDAV
jgi:hypothetical protein